MMSEEGRDSLYLHQIERYIVMYKIQCKCCEYSLFIYKLNDNL